MAKSKISIIEKSLMQSTQRDARISGQEVEMTTAVGAVPTDAEQREAFRKQTVGKYPIPTYSSAERMAILNDYLEQEAQEANVAHAHK